MARASGAPLHWEKLLLEEVDVGVLVESWAQTMYRSTSSAIYPAPAVDCDAAADLSLRHVTRVEARPIFSVDDLSSIGRRVECFFICEDDRPPVFIVRVELQLLPGVLQPRRGVLGREQASLGSYSATQPVSAQDTGKLREYCQFCPSHNRNQNARNSHSYEYRWIASEKI